MKTPEIPLRVRGRIRDERLLVGEGSKGRGRVSLVGRGLNGLSLRDEGVLWTALGVTFLGLGWDGLRWNFVLRGLFRVSLI